jgi:hypothetical protein
VSIPIFINCRDRLDPLLRLLSYLERAGHDEIYSYTFKSDVIVWESQFWERPLAPRLFDAPIDTTFALYRHAAPHNVEMSVRTGYPYVARHLPWYVDDRYLPEDEAFYRERAEGSDVNHWSRTRLPGWLAQAVAERRSRAKAAPSPPSPDNESQPAASLPLIGAWDDEPDPLDETRYTPWGEPGWHSWNGDEPRGRDLPVHRRARRSNETGEHH